MTFIKELSSDKHRHKLGLFLCECGKNGVARISAVKHNYTLSCGCLQKKAVGKIGKRTHIFANRASVKHGKSNSRLYHIWKGIKQRCLNVNDTGYHYYGGRGIKISDEFSSFVDFYNWAIQNGYASGLTIDRRDNEGHYTPENCQWITIRENSKKDMPPRSKLSGRFTKL